MSRKKHLSIFVTDGSELVGIDKDTELDDSDYDHNNGKNFCWQDFDWFLDHFFMSVINTLLEGSPPTKVAFQSKQVPQKWAGARHFVLSFEKFMIVTNNVLNSYPPLDDLTDEDFRYFYELCLKDSMQKVRELREDVKGLYKMLPEDLFVIFAIRPVPVKETTMEFLYEQWDVIMPKLSDILKTLNDQPKE